MDSQQAGPSSSNSRAKQRGCNIFEALRNNESDEDDDFDIDHESDRSSDFSADENEQNDFDETGMTEAWFFFSYWNTKKIM